MAIQNLPPELQSAIQEGSLAREFQQGLASVLSFRMIADREIFPNQVGETITKTRVGLKPPVETPADPRNNANFDNGMTPSSYALEQYTLGINMYCDTIDLNVATSQVAIKSLFLQNAYNNGVQAAQTLDRLARNTLFDAYLGGHTRTIREAKVVEGRQGVELAVDDVRGFEQVMVNGCMEPVSEAHPAVVRVGAVSGTLTSVRRDEQNVSTAWRGVSGKLFVTSLANKVPVKTPIVHVNAPDLVRANQRNTTADLLATDKLTLDTILDAQASLRNNIRMIHQPFKLFLDNQSMRQLFADPQFQIMYTGQYRSETLQRGQIVHLAGIDFVPTTEAWVENVDGFAIRRPILVAPGALIEGAFAGMQAVMHQDYAQNGEVHFVNGVAQVTRGCMDRLQQIIAQSWFWIGGFAVPSDATADKRIIPTANDAYFKRAVVIEHAG